MPLPALAHARRWHGWAAGLGVALLSLSLGLQILVHERDRLAPSWPASRSLTHTLCAWLACTTSHHKRPDALVMDASSFELLDGQTYLLSLSVRSTSLHVLALPSLELTLTDRQDQVLLRRVIHARELPLSQDALGPGESLQTQVGLVLGAAKPAWASDISGYRLLAFYP